MKKTYDLSPSFRGYADAWSYGYHEKTHALVYTTQFPAEDYTTVECPRAFYRIRNRDLNNPQIKSFLARANRLTPREVNHNG